MIVFVHIERTGGSSVHSQILPYFPERNIAWSVNPESLAPSAREAIIFRSLSESTQDDIAHAVSAQQANFYLAGHILFEHLQAFLLNRRSRDILFSTTRDPVERAASLHALTQRSPTWLPGLARVAAEGCFAEFYAAAVASGMLRPNRQCFALSGHPDFEATLVTLQSHYNLLGTYRYYANFTSELEKLLSVQIPHLKFGECRVNAAYHHETENGGWAPARSLEAMVDDETRRQIERDNMHDLELIRFIESQPEGVFRNIPTEAVKSVASSD